MRWRRRRIIIATVVGLVSEFMPIPGMLAAALVFPEGIEGDHGGLYLALAVALNFAFFYTATYYLFGRFRSPRFQTETPHMPVSIDKQPPLR
jgi:hypothetical protein